MCDAEQTTHPAPTIVAYSLDASRFLCRPAMNEDSGKANTMLYTIALVLVILWVLGLVSSYTLGGLIHVLLVLALVAILVNVIGGRRR